MFKNISKYWAYQLFGWILYIAICLFFIITFNKGNVSVFVNMFVSAVLGLLVTHIMRKTIHYLDLMKRPLKKQILFFLTLTLLYAALFALISLGVDKLIGGKISQGHKELSLGIRFLKTWTNSFLIMLIWNFIYIIYHVTEHNREQVLNSLKLEAAVKALELKTIKSHINPHFIFNSLNGIRSLVDENPERARKAITELSNILRSSMSVENMETVPLEQELKIVNDYLALEHMRFEERLKIKMDISPETLQLSVPPMMLQNLVENALKHGISKQLNGGEVEIKSAIENNKLIISVINTGKLNSNTSLGFGIKSTQDRLNILYGERARFEINDIENDRVESKIFLPAH